VPVDETPNEHELLLREYDNAWLHNRHLETLRSQYVGFFLTFLAATVAFAGSRASEAYGSPAKATELSVLLMSISAVTWFVSVSIRRWGVVIRHYDVVILEIRRRSLSAHSDSLVRIKPRSGVGIQQAAEITLLAAHVAILASVTILLIRVIDLDASFRFVAPTALSFVVVTASTLTGASWKAIRHSWASVTAPTDQSMPKGG
jgi:hypothetical protein